MDLNSRTPKLPIAADAAKALASNFHEKTLVFSGSPPYNTRMRYDIGDIWNYNSDPSAWIVIPTNTCVDENGEAIMGKGLALDAAKKYPDLPKRLGRHIQRFGERLFVRYPLICLPTKRDWRDNSHVDLIENGCHELLEFSRVLSSMNSHDNFLLPKLGCGLGGLDWQREVRPRMDSILIDDHFILVYND